MHLKKLITSTLICTLMLTLSACSKNNKSANSTNPNNNKLVVNTNFPTKEQTFNSQADFDKQVEYEFNHGQDLYADKRHNRYHITKVRVNPFGYYKYPIYNDCRSVPKSYAVYKKQMRDDLGITLTRERYNKLAQTYYTNYSPNYAITYNLNNFEIARQPNLKLYEDMFYLPGNSKKVDPALRTRRQLQLLSQPLTTRIPTEINYYKSAHDSAMSNAYKQYITKNSKAIAPQILKNKELNIWHDTTIQKWIQDYKNYHYKYILNPLLRARADKRLKANDLGNNANLQAIILNNRPALKLNGADLYVTNAGYQLLANLPNDQHYLNRMSLARQNGGVYYTDQFGKLIGATSVNNMYVKTMGRINVRSNYQINSNKYTPIILKPNQKVIYKKSLDKADFNLAINSGTTVTKTYTTYSFKKYQNIVKHCTKKQVEINNERDEDMTPYDEYLSDLPYGYDIPGALSTSQRQYLLDHPYYFIDRQNENKPLYVVPVSVNNQLCLNVSSPKPLFSSNITDTPKANIFVNQHTSSLSYLSDISIPMSAVEYASGLELKQK